ncbi:MAG: hypothetical protein WBA54_11045 [Acidaminobacteraceae bacterium]
MIEYLLANLILITVLFTAREFTILLALILLVLLNAKVFYEVYSFLNSLQNIILASDSASYASDLKTPLTSIITYVDLLKKEKFTSENASNYI